MRAQCMPRHAAVHAVCGRPLAFLGSRPGEPGRRPSRPSVRVRTVPRAGAAMQPLRPRPAVLQPRLFGHGPPRSPARRRAALPAQPCGPHGARQSLTALATAAVRAGCRRPDRRDRDRRRRRPRRPGALRDASGLAERAARCSTDRERARQGGERHPSRRTASQRPMLALRRTAVALGAPRLRASRPAALAGSCGRSQPLSSLSSLKESPWSSPPT